MKKVLLATALVLAMGFGANAQPDGFIFNNWSDVNNGVRAGDDEVFPALPTEHGLPTDAPAPLGSGLLILTALGAGYAVSRRKK